MELWVSGYQSLNGGYYYITAITDGYASSYDKKSYITAYYDGDKAENSLGVNYQALPKVGSLFVVNRATSWEKGYATNDSEYAAFDVYHEASVSPFNSTIASAALYQATWGAYWSMTGSLLEE